MSSQQIFVLASAKLWCLIITLTLHLPHYYSLATNISTDPAPTFNCFPSIFSFGDSKADTGLVQAAFPFESAAESPPYGRTFFHRPSDRFCDGRLAIDFQARAYGLPFLSPYLRGLLSDFRHGANFAASGTAALPNLTTVPFHLERQFQQFRKHKANYILGLQHINPEAQGFLAPSRYFGDGLYVISIGENDYRTGITTLLLTTDQIKAQLVPRVIQLINSTVEGLYEEGARKFLVEGIAVDGCTPLLLTVLPSAAEDVDELGCLKSVNEYVRYHNEKLLEAVQQLRGRHADADIAFADYFAVNLDILQNATKYGFQETTKACCGLGGEYNYNINVQCGETGIVEGKNVTVGSCEDPSLFISWDGIHLTEHFYELVAKAFLQGHFVDKPLSLPKTCTLNFS